MLQSVWSKTVGFFLMGVIIAFGAVSYIDKTADVAMATYENCSNGIDDDNDGLADCRDSLDCALATNCEENCSNTIDDDDDGSVDCDDFYCAWNDPACY